MGGIKGLSIEERFWSKVDIKPQSECWNWKGTKDPKGYGGFYLRKDKQHQFKSHRIAYQLTFGEIPEGLCICHKCDNPSCCNPNHLFLGSKSDNNHDAIQKGRAVYVSGERIKSSKLTSQQVIEIKRLSALGHSGRELAHQYRVDRSTIYRILYGISWKTVV